MEEVVNNEDDNEKEITGKTNMKVKYTEILQSMKKKLTRMPWIR